MTRLYLLMRLAERVPSMSLEAQERLTPGQLAIWIEFERVRELEEARDLALVARAGVM